MIFAFIIVLVLIIGAIFFIKRKNVSVYKLNNKIVNQTYESLEGKFEINGRRNKFVIRKNHDIEFLVKDGQIIACKDMRISNDFQFYGGEKNGTV